MENAWSNGIAGERKDLAPIIEEEDKGQAKGFFPFFSCVLTKLKKKKRNQDRRSEFQF